MNGPEVRYGSKIVTRWLEYTNAGAVVEGTNFRAFKTPIDNETSKRFAEDERFTPEMLMEVEPNLALVVDLASYSKFYDKNQFLSRGVDYAKIYCMGKMVPPREILQTFYDVVDRFLELGKGPEAVIGVHCTYGVNRCGYFICKYMIDKMAYQPEDAIDLFEKSRGHKIGMSSYCENLISGDIRDRKPIGIVAKPFPAKSPLNVYEIGHVKTPSHGKKSGSTRRKKKNVKAILKVP